MSGQRVVRPAELPRQRGSQSSDPARKRAGRPPVPSAPRSGRRAPRSRYSPVAESLVGFLICAAVIAATAVLVAVVLAAWLGLA